MVFISFIQIGYLLLSGCHKLISRGKFHRDSFRIQPVRRIPSGQEHPHVMHRTRADQGWASMLFQTTWLQVQGYVVNVKQLLGTSVKSPSSSHTSGEICTAQGGNLIYYRHRRQRLQGAVLDWSCCRSDFSGSRCQTVERRNGGPFSCLLFARVLPCQQKLRGEKFKGI